LFLPPRIRSARTAARTQQKKRKKETICFITAQSTKNQAQATAVLLDYSDHRLQTRMCIKQVRVGTWQDFKWIEGFTTKQKVLESMSYLLRFISKTSFTELHGKPLQTPTLPCVEF
jgi:hypothetical protein